MPDHARERDVEFGRTLAETAERNSPAHIAGAEAKAAVARAGRAAEGRARNRRRFRAAVTIMLVAIALIGIAAWLTECMTQG
ncbi:MAG: hypothetical protein ACE5KF_08165 [Kiloniellaceae bacterium]